MATEKNSRFSSGWKWLIFGFACLGLFALRHNLAGIAVDALLRQAFNTKHGATFAYANIQWDGSTISIDELDIETNQYRLAVQRLEIVLDFSFSPFHASPHVWVYRPYLIFRDGQDSDFLGSENAYSNAVLAAPLAMLDWLRLDVVEGRCEWTPRDSSAPEDLYFQFLSGGTNETLGSLELFSSPDMNGDPLIRTSVAQKTGEKPGFIISWESRNLSTQHLLPLFWTATGHSISGWERIEGGWELKGSLAIDESGQILDMQSALSVNNLELRNAELGLHVAARNISLDLQQLQLDPASAQGAEVPWYQRIEARALIEEGEIACAEPFAEHPWGITHVDGRMVWCENEDPVFSLKGVTIQADGEKELFVQGTGSLGSEQSFWLQTYLTWGAEEKPLLETTLSICSPEPSSLVIEAQVNELQLSAATSLIALFGFDQKELQQFQFGQGTLKGVVTAWLHEDNLHRVELRDVAYDKLSFHWKEKGKATGLSGFLEGSWRLLPSGWTNNNAMLSFHLDEFQPAFATAYGIADMEGECLIEGEKISRAIFKGRLGEVPILCSCEGTTDAYRLQLSSETTLASCLKTFSLASSLDLQAASEIGLQMRFEAAPNPKGESHAKGTILVHAGDDSAKAVAIECAWPASAGFIPKGKIHAAALPVAVGLPFLKKVLPETQCKGDFGIEGAFDDKGIELHIDIPRLSISTPLIAVELLPHKDKRARGVLTASWASEDFRFLLPLSDAKCALPAFGLTFSQVRAWLELDKRQVHFKDLHAVCEGIALQGQLHIDSSGVSLRTDKVQGRIEDLEIVFAKATRYKYTPLGISGDFSSGPEGLLFEAPLDLSHVSSLVFQTAVSSVRMPFAGGGALHDASSTISYNSRQHALKLGETNGILSTSCGADYAWTLQPAVFAEADGQWEGTVDTTLYQQQLELLRCVSLTRLSPDSLVFSIDPRFTHILGSTVEKGKGIYHFKKRQGHYQGVVNWDLEQFGALRELVCDTCLLKAEDLPQSDFFKRPSCGMLRAAFDYETAESQLQFTLEGKNLDLFGTPCPYFGCQGKKQKEQWKISECRWGENRAQFDLSIKKNEIAIPSFSLEFEGAECRGSATYSTLKSEWQCLLQSVKVPVGKERLQFQAKQPVAIACPEKDRCVVKGLVLEEIESRSPISCPLVQIDLKEKAFLVRAQHSLAPKFIKRFLPAEAKNVAISPEEPLEGALQIEGNWQEKFTCQVQGAWKECLFKFKDKPYLFTQLNGRYRDGSLLLGGKTAVGQIQAIASLQIDHKKETLGVFKLQETPQDAGISLFFRLQPNGAFEPSHITGEFSGIKTQLRKKAGAGIHLLGTTDVDFTKLRQLFPRDTAPPWQGLQLGKGFTIEGDLVFQNEQFGFKGEIRGDNCELLDCQIQKLSTGITWMPQRLRLEKLQVTDPALTLAVRSLTLEETAAGKIWTLNCPVAQVREFQPSRLRKIGKPPASTKPFVIRNITLLDVMGDLGNPKTFSGECALHFTNSAKKEESILDVPLEFLKDVGLDPSVLVPIQGELEGHFENGRLLFTALKSSYSEGRRTQFFLSERGDGSYIDLQGNMHIDLAVKQAVVLKLAESLRLGIRGSVAKPLYIILP